MLLAIALPFIWSCSDNGDDINTGQCTVGFASEEVEINEATSGYTNIPINVSGLRNGAVKIKIEAAPVGENGAVEGKHYFITDKTLNINADTLSTGTLNVEVKTLDDNVINNPRQFTLTIVSAKGAEIKTQKTTVTIKDNDGDTYLAFFGTWTLNAKKPVFDADGKQVPGQSQDVSFDVKISGTANENSADYESILTASCPSMFNLGSNVYLDCTWRFRYSYDKTLRVGTLGFICGEQIASYGTDYQWVWATDNGRQYTFNDVTTRWTVAEGKVLPDVIKFNEAQSLYLFQPGQGMWDVMYDITLKKKN